VTRPGRGIRSLPILAAALLVGAGCRPDPRREAEDLLFRIAAAEREVPLVGWRTVAQGPVGVSRETRLRVVRYGDGSALLSWEGPDGAEPRRWRTRTFSPWVEHTAHALRNYDVVADPDADVTVAARAARRVRLVPRIAGRSSVELRVDAETSVVLSESWRGPDGEETLLRRFESVPVGADAETAPPSGWTPLAVTVLPSGFEPVGRPGPTCSGWRSDFTDGVAALSVVQAPVAEGADAPAAGDVRRRSWDGGAELHAVLSGLEVRVSGSLPAAELEGVLRGLAALPPPAR
jgi:hypothetical protein